jgi:hypothetical protein
MMRGILVAAVLPFFLQACAEDVAPDTGSTIVSKLTAFHEIQPGLNKTFVVASLTNKDTLEAKTYADMIAQHLEQFGWRRASGKTSDLRVEFAWGVDNGTTHTEQVPVYGETSPGGMVMTNGVMWGGGTFVGSAYVPPTEGVVGTREVTNQTFKRQIAMRIVDARTAKRVYEGTITSEGSVGDFSTAAPCLVNSIFKDFPGRSGETQTIELPWNSCAAER